MDEKTERQKLLESGVTYLIWGDTDKPFHRPECECLSCEEWRKSQARPTHAEVREYNQKRLAE